MDDLGIILSGDRRHTQMYQSKKLAKVLQFFKKKKRLDPEWKALDGDPDPKNYADPTGPGSTTLDSRAQFLQEKNKLRTVRTGIGSFS